MTNYENTQHHKKNEDCLSAKQLRSVLYYEYETGKFITHKSELTRCIGYTTKYGYTTIKLGKHHYMAHRLAWLYDKGIWPSRQIDHINGDKTDNRIENLRDVEQTLNMHNQKVAHKGSATGLLGAYFHKRSQLFYSQIRVNKQTVQLGCFNSAQEAHQAYFSAKKELHPGCTR